MTEEMVSTRGGSGGGKKDRPDDGKKQPKPNPKGDSDDEEIDWSNVLSGLMQDGGTISVYLQEPPPVRPGKGTKRRRPADNPALSTYDREHAKFYHSLPATKKARIARLERELEDACSSAAPRVPSRFRLLETGAPPDVKSSVMSRVESLFKSDCNPGEKAKQSKWLDAFLRIPFGIRRPLPVTHESSREDIRRFVSNTKRNLDDNIHGHAEAKEQIIRILAKWIGNPQSKGAVIGIQGPPGCGKTTLVRNCIAQALGLPMVMIPLGGLSDSSVLTGHLYTYEGSTCGAVASSLMRAGCMNPVILLDELDKVGGDTHKGQEVVNTLIHLTDPVQNENFVDHYFADVPLDLSRALMVLTFNSLEAINPILRDRMSIIKTSGYGVEDKKHIAKKHLLPRIAAQHGLAGLTITDDAVAEMVKRVDQESGVRNLERAIDTVVGNINLARIMNDDEHVDIIDAKVVSKFCPNRPNDDFPCKHIYM
jgi:ATP-dependent Lon protease